ncbi:hypothetical protein [Cohnella nanjingensis]|uniref:Uncharacterized protein n=1 Tax=Cohnella nanjingensis TaxID=1387779 RepID=A0A7X0VGF4_9BACL|nr:hypothetical protein [Cohnella nanjingensis]MBB6672278.1 hypothetical protein [Cohnella nanjingensis]
MTLIEPWESIEQGEQFETELLREVSESHPLYGKEITAIARRFDCDDVLFQVAGGEKTYFVVVHLTWKMKVEAKGYPCCEFFESLKEFETKRMTHDHKMY